MMTAATIKKTQEKIMVNMHIPDITRALGRLYTGGGLKSRIGLVPPFLFLTHPS